MHALAFRRDMIRVGGFRVGDVTSQDTELLLRVLLSGATIGFNEQGQAIYFRRPRHDGLSARRDFAALASKHAWQRDHLRMLPVAEHPQLLNAYGHRAYQTAVTAFEHGYRPLAREALALAREAGLRGQPGARTHRVVAGLLGLERKVALARAVRRFRSAIGIPKEPRG